MSTADGTEFTSLLVQALDKLSAQYKVSESGVVQVEAQVGMSSVSLEPSLNAGSDEDLSSLRVVVRYRLPELLPALMSELGDVSESLVTLGAISNGVFTAQANLRSVPFRVLAPVVATSAAFGPYGTIRSIDWIANIAPSVPTHESSWSKLDLDALHYQLAHLGAITQDRDGLSLSSANELWGYTSTLTPINNHPALGGGLLAATRCYLTEPWGDDLRDTVRGLNSLETICGQFPLFGTWCARDSDLMYVTFIPNVLYVIPDMAWHALNWQLCHAAWALTTGIVKEAAAFARRSLNDAQVQ